MFKIILIGLCLSFEARAQSLQQLLGIQPNASSVTVRWSCPQHTYPQMRQLRQSADVKMEFIERNGVLSLKLKPDVFKVNPFTLNNAIGLINKNQVSLDYSDCLENFKKSAFLAIEMKKESAYCNNQSNQIICSENISKLSAALDNKIDKAPYFKNKETQIVLPRTLAGSASGSPQEEVQEAINHFKNNQSVNERLLFSAEAIRSIDLNYSNLNQNQLKQYKISLQAFNKSTQKEICEAASNLCNHISQNLSNTESKVETIVDQKLARLKATDDMYLNSLQIPKDETQASKEMKQILDTEPFECNLMNKSYESDGRSFMGTYFPKALSENIDRLAEVADRDCIDSLIQNYSIAMNYRPGSNTSFKEYCLNNETDACKVAQERNRLLDDNLKRLFEASFGERGERYVQELGGIACFLQQESAATNISQIVSEHRAALSCIDLKAGEAKNVSYRDGSPSGLSGNYILKKKANGNHEVKVNIDVISDGYGVSKEEMHQRISTCMEDASPFMKGPDGKNLNFVILTPEETRELPLNERPGLNKVRIQGPGTRSNSMSYKSDIDCPTIAHEVLHLLGLCDEYDGNGDGYSCRTVAKVPSIMSRQSDAYRLGIDKTHTCQCRPGSICERVKNSPDEDLKSFYLQPSIYTLTSYEVRNKYCEYSNAPNSSYSSITEKNSVVLGDISETQITLFTQNLSDLPWPQISRSRFTCSCPSNDSESCKQDLQVMVEAVKNIGQAPRESCPSGSFSIKTEDGVKIDQPSFWNNDNVQFVQKSQLPSLILPSHYERIVGGACASKAKKYNDCAIWAYRNKETTNNCEGKPDYCDNGKEFLGVNP